MRVGRRDENRDIVRALTEASRPAQPVQARQIMGLE